MRGFGLFVHLLEVDTQSRGALLCRYPCEGGGYRMDAGAPHGRQGSGAAAGLRLVARASSRAREALPVWQTITAHCHATLGGGGHGYSLHTYYPVRAVYGAAVLYMADLIYTQIIRHYRSYS